MSRRSTAVAVVGVVLVVLVSAASAAPPLARPLTHPSRLSALDTAKFTLNPKFAHLESGGVFLLPRTCHLQMQFMLSTDGYTHFGAVPPVAWDWNHLPTNIQFQWHDTDANTTSVVWQVSLMPFGDSPKGWQQPPGLVASGACAKAYDTTTFGIDFAKFAPLPPKAGMVHLTTAAQRYGPILHLPAGHKPSTAKAPARRSLQDQTLASASALRLMQLFGPISLYVRVVPLNAKGQPEGFASQPLEVRWGPQASGPPVDFSGFNPPPAVHPVVKISSYAPIHWAEGCPYHLLCVKDVAMMGAVIYHKGTVYDFTPVAKSETPWEQVLDFIKESIDGWAMCYQMLQDCITYVISYEFYQIDPTLGQGIRDGAQVALIAGMAALGLPPALPNYDQLVGLGEDYLVQCAAEQVGVPPDDAKQAVDLIKDQMKTACQGNGDPSVIWVHAPDYCYRPSYLTVSVTNPGAQPTTPLDLVVRNSTYTPSWKDIGDMTGYYYPDGLKSQQVFTDRIMHLPAIKPGQTLTVPVFMRETYDVNKETQSLSDALAWSCWAWGYHRQQTVSISTRLVNPSKSGPDNIKAQDQITWVPDTAH